MTSSTPQISYLEFPATDLDATKAFYTAAFGWTWIDYGPGYAAFDGGDLEVALSADATVSPAPLGGDQSSVGPLALFVTDDLGVTEGAVVAAGGTIATPPFAYPGGRRFHFRDPSGNVLGAYQPAASDEHSWEPSR